MVLQAELALTPQVLRPPCIFWFPPEVTATALKDERQRAFLEQLDQADLDRKEDHFGASHSSS